MGVLLRRGVPDLAVLRAGVPLGVGRGLPMSDAVWIALIAAPATILGAMAQFKLSTIHRLTNSNFTALKEAHAADGARIEKLEALVVNLTGRTVPP